MSSSDFSRIARSAAQTRRLGEQLGRLLLPGDILGLTGTLGAGKTCFAQGLALGLGVPPEERVASPTFNIVLAHQGRVPFHHIDLYRIVDESELFELGIEPLLHEGNSVIAVEWLDRFPLLAPSKALLWVHLEATGERARRISARGPGERGLQLAKAWLGP